MNNKIFPGRIIFDHLPKTAGMSINKWLIDSLGEVVTSNLIGQHSDLIREYGGLYSIISGHIHFSSKEGLDPRYQYITCVRDPVDRTISWLYFISDNEKKIHSVGLVEQVNKFLESNGKIIPEIVANNISNSYVAHFSRILGTGLEAENKRYKNSIHAVRQYDVIGLFEDLPRFMAEIATLIGLPTPTEVPRINITDSRPNLQCINDELIENIRKINHLDIKFYNQVKKIKALDLQKKVYQKKMLSTFGWDKFKRIQNQDLIANDILIFNTTLKEGQTITQGQLINLTVDFVLYREVSYLEMGVAIIDRAGKVVYGTNNKLIGPIHRIVSPGSYGVTFNLFADLPPGVYSVNYTFIEYNSENLAIELAKVFNSVSFRIENQKSMIFEGSHDLSAKISFSQTDFVKSENIVVNPIGKIIPAIPISSMKCGEEIVLPVTIFNQSNQRWIGDIAYPIFLSYHWLTTSGDIVIYEGKRTALPKMGIGSGESMNTELIVVSPSDSGEYTLALTMLQDRVAWFEDIGLDMTRIVVKVD